MEDRCSFLKNLKFPISRPMVLFSLENDTRRVNIHRKKNNLGYAISVGKRGAGDKFWSSDCYVLDNDGNLINGYVKVCEDVKRYPTDNDLDTLLGKIKKI